MKGFLFIIIGLALIGLSIFIARGSRRTPKSEEGKYGRLDSEYQKQEDWSKGIPGLTGSSDADMDFGTDVPAMD